MGEVVIDLGCGTGGFTSGLGTSAIGIERDLALALHGCSAHDQFNVAVADATRLSIRAGSADVAIASLLFHQVARPEVLGEVARVLRRSGRLVIRTVAPDDAAAWVPHRWFPTVAEAQRRRMPSVDTLREECVDAGLSVVAISTVERDRTIVAAAAEQSVHHEVLARYELSKAEIDAGFAHLREADGERYARRHTLIVAVR